MQQQQLHQAHDGRLALDAKAGAVKTRIRDVWKHNLAQEMAVLRQLVEKYPYISMVSSRLGGFGGLDCQTILGAAIFAYFLRGKMLTIT